MGWKRLVLKNSMPEQLMKLCAKGFQMKGLGDEYAAQLKEEMREVAAQDAENYFLSLYEKGVKYPYNQNNLLTPYLLGIVPDFNISNPPEADFGDYPDVDLDYIAVIRDYLKHEWAPKTFGHENVCSIGNYTTFGIKSAFIDMARVFGCDRDEILSLTTKLGLKDEDGKELTFDKALEEHPELNAYCERNPDVADAVQHCLHRNRGMGVHAGGLIISNKRLDALVPLVRGKDDTPVSAWVEGLRG